MTERQTQTRSIPNLYKVFVSAAKDLHKHGY